MAINLDFDGRVRKARRRMYGRCWWLNPLNWSYRRRRLLPGLVVLRVSLVVTRARRVRMRKELEDAVQDQPST